MANRPMILIACTVLFELILCSDTEYKVVNTTSGPVKGYKSMYGDFLAFYGIPYATAPTGSKKFNAPLPAPVWKEPLEAINDNIFCPQVRIPIHWAVTDHYQEDCLIVNVFVPNLPDLHKTNLSVVVYIHGGAYQIGKGNRLRPYEFLNEAKDIIVVNFNYRLGIQGFLCLGTEDVPGNAGMKDQVAALRWVKKNIASFGGNAEDIALAGYSAGASAADLLMMSEMTEGLFTKIILDSGVGYDVWSVQIKPLEIAKEFARQLNFTTDDVWALETFYKNLTLDKLTSDSFSKRFDHTFAFVPCVERDLGQEMFLKEAPVDILKRSNIKKLPTLVGFANMEGLIRMEEFEEWKDIMNNHFSKFLPADLEFKSEKDKQLVAELFQKFYFNDSGITNDTLEAFFNFLGDGMFAYPIIRNARMQAKAGNNQIYLYQYTYIDDNISSTYAYPEVKRANHCAQSFAVLEEHGTASGTGYSISREYRRMKSILRKLWANFIKTGKPVPVLTPELPQGWPAFLAQRSQYLELDLPPRLKNDLLTETVRFWDSIYDVYYKKPVSVSS